MGNSIYYGLYSKECDNEKIFPYLTHDDDYDVYIKKEDQPRFFEILRKYAKHYENERCYVMKYYEDMYNFLCEAKDIVIFDGPLEDTLEIDLINFDNGIIVFWVL